MTASPRRDELAANLARVRDVIARTAAAAGRNAEDVSLIVVTKTFPASDVRILHELGVRDVGENRHLEARDKAAELDDLDLVWHFIGQVQSNKAARIAAYADVVHSVDDPGVARRLGAAAVDHRRVVTCLVQVNLDPPAEAAGRGGVAVSDIEDLAAVIEDTEGVRFGGLMGIASLGEAPESAFGRLADTWHAVRRTHPAATMLSAGMSGDFPAAIKAGATHVRVGSAVLGERPSLR